MNTTLHSALRWLSDSIGFSSVMLFADDGKRTRLKLIEKDKRISNSLSEFTDVFIQDIESGSYTVSALGRNPSFGKRLAEAGGSLLSFKKMKVNDKSLFYLIFFGTSEKSKKAVKEIPDSFFKHFEALLNSQREMETAAGQKLPDSFISTLPEIEIALFSAGKNFKELTFLTNSIEAITGVKADIFLSDITEFVNLVDEEFYSDYRWFIRELIEGERAAIDLKIHAGSDTKYIRLIASPDLNKNTNERIIHGAIINVTEQIRFNRYLQKIERQLKMLIETSGDIIFLLDFRGNFIMVNNNGALSLEYTREEMIGKHFLDFVDKAEKPSVAKAFGRLLKSSRLISFEALLKTKFGKAQSFLVNARSTFKNEQLDSVLGIATDITMQKEDSTKIDDLNNKLLEASRIILIERDRARQKITVLEELNKMKSEFVSNISHELRTPLASMIGFAETIDSDPEMPPAMRKEFNQIILNESKRLSKLIDNVLDVSKLEGGKIVLEKTKFSITEGLNKVIEQASKEAKMKSLVFSSEIPSEDVYIYADPARIEQLFENLMNNALKFTSKGGRISVFAQNFYNEYEVIISDTGIGIPKDDLPFIFQKFYRVSRKDKNIPGPGLGLSIVKQIVDMHKGMITIQSEEKKGTTVVIKLPIIKQK